VHIGFLFSGLVAKDRILSLEISARFDFFELAPVTRRGRQAEQYRIAIA
jgi:hypothetical protein